MKWNVAPFQKFYSQKRSKHRQSSLHISPSVSTRDILEALFGSQISIWYNFLRFFFRSTHTEMFCLSRSSITRMLAIIKFADTHLDKLEELSPCRSSKLCLSFSPRFFFLLAKTLSSWKGIQQGFFVLVCYLWQKKKLNRIKCNENNKGITTTNV